MVLPINLHALDADALRQLLSARDRELTWRQAKISVALPCLPLRQLRPISCYTLSALSARARLHAIHQISNNTAPRLALVSAT